MRKFLRCLHSDFLKIKRRPVLWVHLFIPIMGIVIFLLFDIFHQSYSSSSTASGLLGAIAAAFPTLIGVVCSMVAEQEAEAGNFQGLLTNSSRLMPFFSMTATLLLLGAGSVFLTVFGFEAGFAVLLHQAPFGPDFYLCGALLLFGSNLFIYIFHLFLSLRFNKSVSIGIGIVESMMSALLITGLGDGIWVIVPCAWGLRFLKLFEIGSLGGTIPAGFGLDTGVVLCFLGTLLIFAFSLIWFLRWEGKKTEE